MKRNRQISFAVIFLVLGIAISLQYKSIQKNNSITNQEGKTIQDVQAQLLAQKEQSEALSKKINEYEETISNYQKNANVEDVIKQELEKAQILAGLTTVKGKGIIVTIDESKTQSVEGIVPTNQGITLSDGNLLELLNELRASGAEAISINEERILATTEIRKAGSFIRINNKNYNGPFVFKAIGEPGTLKNSLEIREGILQYLRGMVYVKVDTDDNIVIPKYNGVINFKYLTKM